MNTRPFFRLLVVSVLAALSASADQVRFDAPAAGSSHFTSIERIAGRPVPGPSAGITPLAISLVPPVQFPDENWDVCGLRLNLFVGRHRDVSFVDLGLLGNNVDGNLTGLEVAGLFNRIGSSDGAIQVAGLFNYVERDFCGVQGSLLVNRSDGDLEGLQLGSVNLGQDVSGLQVGLFNRAERANGLQIGLVNYAYQMQGVQIGLINVIADSNVPFMIGLNAAF